MAAIDIIIRTFGTFKLIFLYGWPFFLLLIIGINRMTWRKYPIEAIIIEKRGDNLIKTNDRVGKFFDVYSDMTYYKLKKSGDTIPVYNFDWVLHNVSIPTNILEKYINIVQGNSGTIFLFRYGSKQYKPIDLNQTKDNKKKLVEVKDDKGDSVYTYQYIQFDPRDKMGTLDFEVIDWDNMNFMVQEQRASIIRRQRKGDAMNKYIIPLAIIGASVVVSIFILKFSLDAGTQLQGSAPAPAPAGNALDNSNIGGAIGNVFNPGT